MNCFFLSLFYKPVHMLVEDIEIRLQLKTLGKVASFLSRVFQVDEIGKQSICANETERTRVF